MDVQGEVEGPHFEIQSECEHGEGGLGGKIGRLVVQTGLRNGPRAGEGLGLGGGPLALGTLGRALYSNVEDATARDMEHIVTNNLVFHVTV